ncbi:hypothetical protein HDU81_002610 [Chytriomyces hyalinus]|nr:hypothetical protein HDU81_002610 [Chytriomyces hyalinus]
MFSSGTDNNKPNTSTYSTTNPNTGYSATSDNANTGYSTTENPKLPTAPVDTMNPQTSKTQNVSSDYGSTGLSSQQPSFGQGQQQSVSQGLYDAGNRAAEGMGLKQKDQGSTQGMYDEGVSKVKDMGGQGQQSMQGMYDEGVSKVKGLGGQQQDQSSMQGMYDTGNRAAQDMGLKQDQGSTYGTGAGSTGGSQQQQPSMMSKMEHGAKKLFGKE